ncbi:hypothetical protein [Noviherbaspirillum humi]|uniref:hypothetical protein n=1 Tax=Noviherbaspirillum humi TaxID=1688639 RepID=UPI0015960FFA|nr:hypothetical protein [Noviherbaspirillum humi]
MESILTAGNFRVEKPLSFWPCAAAKKKARAGGRAGLMRFGRLAAGTFFNAG